MGKGKALERALETIEKHVLQDISKHSKAKITITPNMRYSKNGVRNEVDVYVEVDLGIGVPLKYIFESKNYDSKSISKNDIIIFNEKIQDLGVQKGFFAAKIFGRDAILKSKEYNRMELLQIGEGLNADAENILQNFGQIKYKVITTCNVTLNYKINGPSPQKNIEELSIIINGKATSVHDLTLAEIHKKYRDFVSASFVDENTIVLFFSYPEHEVFIENTLCYSLEIVGKLVWETRLPKIIYSFDVTSKGRYIMTESEDIFGHQKFITEMTNVDGNLTFVSWKPKVE